MKERQERQNETMLVMHEKKKKVQKNVQHATHVSIKEEAKLQSTFERKHKHPSREKHQSDITPHQQETTSKGNPS